MHGLMLMLMLLLAQAAAPKADTKPLKVWANVPPMARSCEQGTAAVRYNKDNVEHAACYKRLKCDDGTAYGTGACVCKPGMPLLDQDEVVVGCTKTGVRDQGSGVSGVKP